MVLQPGREGSAYPVVRCLVLCCNRVGRVGREVPTRWWDVSMLTLQPGRQGSAYPVVRLLNAYSATG